MGERFQEALRTAVSAVQSNPETGVVIEPPLRMKRLRRFPYAIIFVELEGTVWIIAVHHDRQDSDYWSDRLEDVAN